MKDTEMTRMDQELYVADERVKDTGAVLDELVETFADNEAMQARLKALKAEDISVQSDWLASRPDRTRMEPASGCAIVVVTVVVTVVIGYEIYQWFNKVTQQMEERRRAITEEREEQREKEVCPDKP